MKKEQKKLKLDKFTISKFQDLESINGGRVALPPRPHSSLNCSKSISGSKAPETDLVPLPPPPPEGSKRILLF